MNCNKVLADINGKFGVRRKKMKYGATTGNYHSHRARGELHCVTVTDWTAAVGGIKAYYEEVESTQLYSDGAVAEVVTLCL